MEEKEERVGMNKSEFVKYGDGWRNGSDSKKVEIILILKDLVRKEEHLLTDKDEHDDDLLYRKEVPIHVGKLRAFKELLFQMDRYWEIKDEIITSISPSRKLAKVEGNDFHQGRVEALEGLLTWINNKSKYEIVENMY